MYEWRLKSPLTLLSECAVQMGATATNPGLCCTQQARDRKEGGLYRKAEGPGKEPLGLRGPQPSPRSAEVALHLDKCERPPAPTPPTSSILSALWDQKGLGKQKLSDGDHDLHPKCTLQKLQGQQTSRYTLLCPVVLLQLVGVCSEPGTMLRTPTYSLIQASLVASFYCYRNHAKSCEGLVR